MTLQHLREQAVDCLRAGAAFVALWQMSVGGALLAQDAAPQTVSPIKHVILIIGENRTFDHIFATYRPKKGESVDNLLSKKIIKRDGTPGPNYSLAAQYSADVTSNPVYDPSPSNKTLYTTLPAPLAGGPTNVCTNNGICTLADGESSENGLPIEYYPFLLSGGTGLTNRTPDSRITGVSQTAPYSTLMPGPFHLTNNYGCFSVLLLCRESRTPFLSDVAATRLQRRACYRYQPQRLPERSVPLGGGYGRIQRERQSAAHQL